LWAFDAWAEAQAYLRSNSQSKAKADPYGRTTRKATPTIKAKAMANSVRSGLGFDGFYGDAVGGVAGGEHGE